MFTKIKLFIESLYIIITNKHFEYMKSQLKQKPMSSMTPMITEEFDRNTQLKSVFDKLLEERIIYLGTGIDDDVANTINAQLLYLDSITDEENPEPIYIYINSPGGDVYSGLAIYDTMQLINSPVYTVVTGLAASMAFVIAVAGEKRYALKNSRLMQHQPISHIGWAQATDIEIENKEIQLLKKLLIEIIAEHTNQKVSKVRKDCERDYWMSAQDAVKYGAIDEIKVKK